MKVRRLKVKQIGLRSKPAAKGPWGHLPFVGKDHAEQSCWDVPMTGGYWGGIEVGEAMARVYLKYVRGRQVEKLDDTSMLLRAMLEGMDKKQTSTPEEASSLRGQRVGFMSEICVWLSAAAQRLGSSFDAIPERSFVAQANEALTFTDASLMAAIAAGGAK
jgi:hypothetical protein